MAERQSQWARHALQVRFHDNEIYHCANGSSASCISLWQKLSVILLFSASGLPFVASAGSSSGCILCNTVSVWWLRGAATGDTSALAALLIFPRWSPHWCSSSTPSLLRDSSVSSPPPPPLNLVTCGASHSARLLNLRTQYWSYLTCVLTLPSDRCKRAGGTWRNISARARLRLGSGRAGLVAMAATYSIGAVGHPMTTEWFSDH